MDEASLLEWAGISIGKGDVYRLYLSVKKFAESLPAEVDRLRFCINSNNIDNSNNNNNNDTIIEVNDAIEFMNRIINYKCIDSILDENEMIGLRKLIEIKLPLKSSFAEICERLWIKVLTITGIIIIYLILLLLLLLLLINN